MGPPVHHTTGGQHNAGLKAYTGLVIVLRVSVSSLAPCIMDAPRGHTPFTAQVDSEQLPYLCMDLSFLHTLLTGGFKVTHSYPRCTLFCEVACAEAGCMC